MCWDRSRECGDFFWFQGIEIYLSDFRRRGKREVVRETETGKQAETDMLLNQLALLGSIHSSLALSP